MSDPDHEDLDQTGEWEEFTPDPTSLRGLMRNTHMAELSLLDALYRAPSLAMLSIDICRATAVTRGFSSLLGWSTEDLRGTDLIEFIHEDDRQAALSSGEGLLYGSARLVALRTKHKMGVWRQFLWALLLCSHNGTLLAVGVDLSDDPATWAVVKQALG